MEQCEREGGAGEGLSGVSGEPDSHHAMQESLYCLPIRIRPSEASLVSLASIRRQQQSHASCGTKFRLALAFRVQTDRKNQWILSVTGPRTSRGQLLPRLTSPCRPLHPPSSPAQESGRDTPSLAQPSSINGTDDEKISHVEPEDTVLKSENERLRSAVEQG